MDFWSRLVGGTYGSSRKGASKSTANDPQTRLTRFKRAFATIHDLCNRPRDISNEGPILEQLATALDRLVQLIRDETRAPVPHLCLQYAATSQLYTLVGRAATVSGYGPVIHAAVSVFAALVDSEEEDFVSSAPFARSLMRLVTKVVDSGNVIIGIHTETAILELLFTVTAKIRLEPEILPVWFKSTAKPELEDVFIKEKKSFVGITQKDDFPLCYLLIDRVHYEGRIGDFARTGLLYVFEATGRSANLEEWLISSDIPTLMASGLGALYSQLSRELSILHPDATLPAVLAMSDYSTTHTKPTAESAFSGRHQAHMTTFLSYLAFWQDVLDHCKSADVKQTLLDHFQILFLQQLLYPSILQSSDTDAGSSVAVLTYMAAMLEALEYPDLIHMMLTYLLAIKDDKTAMPLTPVTPVRPSMLPRSPSTLRRRESLMLLTAPKDPEEALEPTFFSLVDLVLNSVHSRNSQTVFAALRLATTLFVRQSDYAIKTLLKTHQAEPLQRTPAGISGADSRKHLAVVTESAKSDAAPQQLPARSAGALVVEVEKYTAVVVSLYGGVFPEETYTSLCEDVRFHIEAQASEKTPTTGPEREVRPGVYAVRSDDLLMQPLSSLLASFLTNSVDVNLALTQAIVAVASCIGLRLDAHFAVDPASHRFIDDSAEMTKTWRDYLDDDEQDTRSATSEVSRRPVWSEATQPLLYSTLHAVAKELEDVRRTVPNFDQLLAGRQTMLQVTTDDGSLSQPPSTLR